MFLIQQSFRVWSCRWIFCIVNSYADPQYRPNHILINEYQPGQGILFHTDGPQYHPKTATISIGGSHVMFHFQKNLRYQEEKDEEESLNPSNQNEHTNTNKLQTWNEKESVFVSGNGSCLVFEKEAYTHYYHGIHEVYKEPISSSCCLNYSDYVHSVVALNGGNEESRNNDYSFENKTPNEFIQRGYRVSLTFRHKKVETR